MIWRRKLGFSFSETDSFPARPSDAVHCLTYKQRWNEAQMGTWKEGPHFDTWSKGICMVWGGRWGLLFLCHRQTTSSSSYSTRPAASEAEKPLTRPHLLAPGLDIVALSKARLANPKTRFSSVSQKVWFGADRHLGWSSIHTHTHTILTHSYTHA